MPTTCKRTCREIGCPSALPGAELLMVTHKRGAAEYATKPHRPARNR